MIQIGLPRIHDEVLAMRRAGHSVGVIAEVLGVARLTVADVIDRHGDPLDAGRAQRLTIFGRVA